MSFDKIPVLDFSAAQTSDPEARKKLAEEVREVCLTIGFFYVKNHGVPQELVDKIFGWAEHFFSLPTDEKMKVDMNLSEHFKGYSPVMSENVDPANRGDLHEAFDVSNVLPGHWPDIPGFKEDLTAYFDATIALSQRMMRIIALALHLDETFFDDKTTNPASVLRILHYPPQTGVHDERVLGIGAHSDYDLVTILAQDSVGGLQVLNRDQKWVDATPIPGTFVVNIADQLMRWTNDTFVSTVHRAINRTGKERYSIPMFFGSNYDAVVEPLPTCVSAERPAKYPPVLGGEYVQSRLAATHPKHHNTTVVAAAA